MNRFALILLCFVVILGGCKKTPPEEINPEQQLLDIFKSELRLLQNSSTKTYLEYVGEQVATFNAKQKKLEPLIRSINKKFAKLTEGEKISYQKKWRDEFQPIVDAIGDETQKLISRQTAGLTPERMAHIEKLTIRQQELEKEHPPSKLEPVFFSSPE